ncbi:MAG: hotdog domain-containing protein [Pseudomonadota bacterium]|nr:hotdog domain-containing protein [Pseudomonadota bacterium]
MKTSLTPGTSLNRRIEINRERTIDFMGDELRVYSTPSMVSDMEYTCRDLIMGHAEDDEDSVGAHISVDHLAPTLLDMWVDVIATVTAVEGSRISFDVEVRDTIEQVGHGQHVRFMINKEKQAGRLRKKAARAIGL